MTTVTNEQIWRKSSFSGQHNNCVEVADFPGATAVRDSKDPEAGHVAFSAPEWAAFLTAARGGEL